MDHPPLGELCDWEEIADPNWNVLLLGNGLSINVWPRFDYESLYEEANEPDFEDGLGPRERSIFEAFDTTNFEVVLAKLQDGITLARVAGKKTGTYRRLFREVQAALGRTVRRVHVDWVELPDSTLELIKDSLGEHQAIFSTSYDLLVYWAIVSGEEYDCFCDCFWANDRNEFDPEDCEIRRGNVPVYYLHGALHLLVEGSGTTRKLVKSGGRLLDQFGKPVKGDQEARPLLISEGSHRDKLQAIEANEYLAHVYETLKKTSEPLLVFGHSLGEQDQHLIEAINANPDRPVAISMRRKSGEELRAEQARIYGKLRTTKVHFYDAKTHPLGSPELRLAEY
jgi:hypothetical protein